MKALYKYRFLWIGILLLSGCSITKRVYQPGYHIEWKRSFPQNENHPASSPEETVKNAHPEFHLTALPNENNWILASAPPQKTSKKESAKSPVLSGKKKTLPAFVFHSLEKIRIKPLRKVILSSLKGVNLQEPSGQLYLLGILSLIFIGLGITLLYFKTPPQVQTGSILLLVGAICLLAFLSILGRIFADWAFG